MAIINITKEIFEEQILKADQPVLVDFWAPWCTYCRRIAPTFDKIAEQQEDKLVFAKVNVDEAPEIAEKYGTIQFQRFFFLKTEKWQERSLHRILRQKLKHLFKNICKM